MARKFIENYYKEPWRGYGPGPPKIFRMIKSGRKWNENLDRELYPGGSFGNGSAMRVAPIGLLYFDDPEKLREVAYGSSRITHSHPLGLEGAALQAYTVALAVREEPLFLKELITFTRIDLYNRKLKIMEKLLDRKGERKEVVKELGNGVEAFRIDSLVSPLARSPRTLETGNRRSLIQGLPVQIFGSILMRSNFI